MSCILCIDTSVQTSSICLLHKDSVIAIKENKDQKESAAWLQVAIKDLVTEQGISLQQLNAVAVSAGPGSYTGLRVSMASAKGLCYALHIPLILLNTLQVMVYSALIENTDLYCPMIDARRMEVFTAIYDKNRAEVIKPHPLILDPTSFSDLLATNSISFFGNGSLKFEAIQKHPNARFLDVSSNAGTMAKLALEKYRNKDFADLAYSEPFYIKEFQSPFFKPLI